MDIQSIIRSVHDPKPYDKGTAVMWTDDYISKQLLAMHTDPASDIASRREESIEKTVEWLAQEYGEEKGDILDLGCGPGLYAEKLAQRGYYVTGVDFSRNSISYANETARLKGLDIRYLCMDYLKMDFQSRFDLVLMIYCDFGVLSLDERKMLVHNVYRALKPGGMFIFDALNLNAMKSAKYQKDWQLCEKGFWSDKPYLVLSESFFFPENKAVLDQHIVVDEEGGYKIYRFWNHYFDFKDVEHTFLTQGFRQVYGFENLLESGGAYNGENVSFYKICK